jgi:Flp pilus assembly pilin Flp
VAPPPALNPHGRNPAAHRPAARPGIEREHPMSRAGNDRMQQRPLLKFAKQELGQDLAEYGMLAALIAVVVIVALVAVGTAMSALWGNITAAFAGLP